MKSNSDKKHTSLRRKLKEIYSIQVAKHPRRTILIAIILLNIIFCLGAATVIYSLAPDSLSDCDLWDTIFYTITMMLDAGCVSFVVDEAAFTSGVVMIVCMLVVIIGIILFTGAVIGYLTNWISGFIEKSDEGERKLALSDHTIILNWNSRASEIVNDLLFCETPQKVVVLTDFGRKKIEKEIEDHLADTIARERKKGNKIDRKRLMVIVREGETYSTKQLTDISIFQAKAVIILGKDLINTVCQFNFKERIDRLGQGNTDVIKTLIQVSEMTGAEESADNQRIVVEVEDDWTLSIIEKVIEFKQVEGKCNIVPVAVNRILGQILSQFSIMPELNEVYSTLFSNKGSAFYCIPHSKPDDENRFMQKYLEHHRYSIPLGFLDARINAGERDSSGADVASYMYFMSDSEKGIHMNSAERPKDVPLKLKPFRMEKKNVIILGHNSKSRYIMEGFNSFRNEWNERVNGQVVDEIMNIMVIDDEESLQRYDYYREYPQVTSLVTADIYEKEKIVKAIEDFAFSKKEDTSILILSDDRATTEELDGNVMVYLVYVEEIIANRKKVDSTFKAHYLDVIVEILNPKNADVISNYGHENVVISNRYVSKMMTQISEKEALFTFYNDLLTYDNEDAADSNGYDSKEIYAKKVSDFFESWPETCTARELIYAVFQNGAENNKSLMIGYVDEAEKEKVVLFDGNQDDRMISLKPDDKVIVYTNH